MNAPFHAWLWPDRVIGKRESRRLREEQNALVNSHADLLAALEKFIDTAEMQKAGGDSMLKIQFNGPALTSARAAISRAKGQGGAK